MDHASPRRRAILIVIGLLALVLGPLATYQLTLTAPRSAALIVADIAVGWSMIGAGLIIADRRPDTRMGPLVILTGIAWFAGDLTSSTNAVVSYTANVAHGWFDPLFAIVILSYPTGRLVRPVDRALAAGFIVVQLGWTLVKAYTVRPIAWWSCPDCLPTVDAWIAADTAAGTLGRIETAALTALSIGVLIAVTVRFVRASGPARARMAPVVFAGVVLALGFTGGFLLQTLAPASARTAEGELRVLILAILRIGVAAALLVGVLRDASGRSRVADLVVRLDRLPSTGVLQDSLRDALSDPSAAVYRWDPATDAYLDVEGRAVDVPADDATHAVVTIASDGAPALAIALDPAFRDDPGLIAATAAAVRLAVENDRLQAEVRHQLDAVQASRARIVEAQDSERRRLERDLHDGAQQRLVSLQLSLQLLRRQLGEDADPAAIAELDAATEEARQAVTEIRELARGVHPAVLTEAGLGAALASLADRSPVAVELDDGLAGRRLPPAVEATAYFVAAETLTNAARHAGAQRIRIQAREDGETLHLEIDDDGRGGAAIDTGTGLRGLDDRVAALGGTFELTSPSGGGTRIVVELPCASS